MQITPDAAKIRRWREERCWSQEHLADMAGISLRTVQRIENGDTVARESVLALAAAFNVDVSILMLDAKIEAKKIVQNDKAMKNARLRFSFWISLACYLFGMILFTAISLVDGREGFTMMIPALWWTVGVAGHGLAVVLAELVVRFERQTKQTD